LAFLAVFATPVPVVQPIWRVMSLQPQERNEETIRATDFLVNQVDVFESLALRGNGLLLAVAGKRLSSWLAATVLELDLVVVVIAFHFVPIMYTKSHLSTRFHLNLTQSKFPYKVITAVNGMPVQIMSVLVTIVNSCNFELMCELK